MEVVNTKNDFIGLEIFPEVLRKQFVARTIPIR